MHKTIKNRKYHCDSNLWGCNDWLVEIFLSSEIQVCNFQFYLFFFFSFYILKLFLKWCIIYSTTAILCFTQISHRVLLRIQIFVLFFFSLLLLNISATGLVVFCGQSNISIKPLPLIQENCVLKIVGLWKQSLKYHVLYKLTCQKMAILKLLYIISEKSNSITNNY